MSLFYAYKGRGITKSVTIKDASGNTITPESGDKLRVTIGREGETAKLTFTSDAATSNGSSITKGAANLIRLDASDLSFDSGIYTLTLDMYDADDGSGEWKTVDRQVFVLE